MKIASKAADRKQLVRALEEATGLKSRYLFSPSFAYEIGPYTVERSGDLVVEDEKAQTEVLSALAARELIDPVKTKTTDEAATIMSLPMTGHDGRSLRNLVFMLHAKGVLLGRAVGIPGYYKVSEKLITDLDSQTPGSTEDFLQILNAAGDEALHGLSFEGGKIGFLFPYTEEPDRIHTFMQLATLMTNAARSQNRVQPDKCKVTNEKYTFRVWLMRLGMMGEEYSTARKVLLQNLTGHTAFRTKDQADAASEKLKRKRAAEKEAAREMAFEEL